MMYRKVLTGLLAMMLCASLASCGNGESLSRLSSDSSAAELSAADSSENSSSQPESSSGAESETDTGSEETASETESTDNGSTPETDPESAGDDAPAEPETDPDEHAVEDSVPETEDESADGPEDPGEPDEQEDSEQEGSDNGGTAKGTAASVQVGEGWIDLTENKDTYLDAFVATLNNENLVESLRSSDRSTIESLYGYWAEGASDVELFFHISAPYHYTEFEDMTFDQYKERFKSMWNFAADNAADVGYSLSINDSLEFNGIKFIEAEMDFDSTPAGCSVEKVYQAFRGGSTYSISFFAISKDAQEIMDGEIESILSTFTIS